MQGDVPDLRIARALRHHQTEPLNGACATSVVLPHQVSQLAVAERAAGLIVTGGFIARASE